MEGIDNMTEIEEMKSKFPKMKSERHTKKNGEVYYLIRNGNNTMYLSSGKSKKEAWKNALEFIKKE